MTRFTRRVAPTAALAAAAGMLIACGTSTSGVSAAMDATVQTELRADVHAVTVAVAAHRPGRARAALAVLTADTAAAHTAGRLSDTAFARIRAASTQLAADLNRPTAGATPTVTTTAPPARGKPPKGKGKGGHGQGGHGDD